ncbi:hypothetical protein AB0D65_15735 [Streptomyces griseoloalbus]|uniref:Uncharacterized protein n=1 Tax=Streptomyces griseoloalbus TaxID=67303 RepID=A0ABV3E5J1_9ACTN
MGLFGAIFLAIGAGFGWSSAQDVRRVRDWRTLDAVSDGVIACCAVHDGSGGAVGAGRVVVAVSAGGPADGGHTPAGRRATTGG